jgi:uncharacterized protein
MPAPNEILLDCDEGRRRGCASFCCRLIVRLTPSERARGIPGVEPSMNCVPKRADGDCIHFDREAKKCRIWDERPRVCREYDCNQDDLLPIVLRGGFRSLVKLVCDAAASKSRGQTTIPKRGEKNPT